MKSINSSPIFRLVIVLFLIMLFFSARNTSSQTQEKVDLRTPQSAVKTHLMFLQKESFDLQKSARALDGRHLKRMERRNLALQLKQIFDGKGQYIEIEKISDNSQHKDSLRNNSHIYVLDNDEPRIFLEKVGNSWMYSKKTVDVIGKIHKEVYPFGTHNLLDLARKLNLQHKKFLGLDVWQYLGLLIIILAAFLIHIVLKFIIEKIVLRVFSRFSDSPTSKKRIIAIAKPISISIIIGYIMIFYPVLQIPIFISKYAIIFLKVLMSFYCMMIAYRFVDFVTVYLNRWALSTESTLDDQLIPLITRSLKFIFIAIGILFVLQNLGFSITGLLAGISISGLALALAAQDMLKNLFGSFMIFVDRPFQIGDWIIGSSLNGSVEEVGFRSTRVRTFHNSVVSIPNGKIADMTIDNMGVRNLRRFKTMVTITYDTPPELIEVFVASLKKIVEEHPKTVTNQSHIYLNNLGSTSIDILFYTFFEVADWKEELTHRQELIFSIIKVAKQLNVRFAFPTSTIHVEDFPEKKTLTPQYEGDKATFMALMDTYFDSEK